MTFLDYFKLVLFGYWTIKALIDFYKFFKNKEYLKIKSFFKNESK